MAYSKEIKAVAIKMMLPPNSKPLVPYKRHVSASLEKSILDSP